MVGKIIRNKIMSGIAAGMLLLAVPDIWPYNYYVLLRWVVAVFSIFVAWQSYKNKSVINTIIFALITIIFNPISPVYMAKELWVYIDIGTAILFVWWGFYYNYSPKQ